MKKIVLLTLMTICLQATFAQQGNDIAKIDSLTKVQTDVAIATFKADSASFMVEAREKLDKKIQNINKKAEEKKQKLKEQKSKEQKTAKNKNGVSVNVAGAGPIAPNGLPSAHPDTIETSEVIKTDTLQVYKDTCDSLLSLLTINDNIITTRKYLLEYINNSNSIESFFKKKADITEIDSLLKIKGLAIKELGQYLKDWQKLEFANSVLTNPYNREKRVKAQNFLKNLEFKTNNELYNNFIDSLSNGLDIYYLATSNMLDFLNEIEENKKKWDKEKDSVAIEELKFSINFEARVINFRSVKYMSDLYDKVLKDVLNCDKGNINIRNINIDKLKLIRHEVEAMRNKKTSSNKK